MDHVIPKAQGGTNHHLNLVAACAGCNTEKGNQTGIQWAVVLATVGDYERARKALSAQSRSERALRRRAKLSTGSPQSYPQGYPQANPSCLQGESELSTGYAAPYYVLLTSWWLCLVFLVVLPASLLRDGAAGASARAVVRCPT